MTDTPTLEALRQCRDALKDMLMQIGANRENGVDWVCEPIHSDEIRGARAALAAADAALSVQAEPAPAWTVNRYCSVAMCLAGDKQHEPDCAHHNITGAPDHG